MFSIFYSRHSPIDIIINNIVKMNNEQQQSEATNQAYQYTYKRRAFELLFILEVA